MNDADIKRAIQIARRQDTAKAWRELAGKLRKAGYKVQASQAEDKANELALIELEKKEGRQ
jgi:hypothetical protein